MLLVAFSNTIGTSRQRNLVTSCERTQRTDLFAPDFLLLLLDELGGNAPDVLHGAAKQFPELRDEGARVLLVQEASHVDLHVLPVRKLQENGEGNAHYIRSTDCDPHHPNEINTWSPTNPTVRQFFFFPFAEISVFPSTPNKADSKCSYNANCFCQHPIVCFGIVGFCSETKLL